MVNLFIASTASVGFLVCDVFQIRFPAKNLFSQKPRIVLYLSHYCYIVTADFTVLAG